MAHLSEFKLLIIGAHFPEPNSSAAGSRMMQLIKIFLLKKWKISFASAAQTTDFSEDLVKLGIEVYQISPNDEKADSLFKKINPEVVIFDRFMMEEQFGWRVAEVCPEALRILDTEDLHFLRHARHQAFKEKRKVEDRDLFDTMAQREIAAILRSDISLIISEAERNLLIEKFNMDEQKVWYLPFLINPIKKEKFHKLPDFKDRKDFMFIGNFLHAPNYDAVLFLKNEIWPSLQNKIPDAGMLIYGAYASQKVFQLENKSQRFFIKGRAEDKVEVFKSSKILLAPLRFGAGLKGKIFDAMENGTPIITTSVGAEGIAGNLDFAGKVADSKEEIVQAALELYDDPKKWKQAQKNGKTILKERFDIKIFKNDFFEKISFWMENKEALRSLDFYGRMLRHHHLQSTKYMSRWIETKNLLKQKIK